MFPAAVRAGECTRRYRRSGDAEDDHMKKRITAWAVTAAMLALQLSPIDIIPVTLPAAAAGTGASVELQTYSASGLAPGDKFYADVSVDPMVCSTFSLNASWDRDCLELTNAVVNGSSFAGTSTALTYVPFASSGGTSKALPALDDYRNGAADDVCIFAFSSPINVSCSGTAATLEFTVKQNAENGISEINVYFDGSDAPKYFGSEHKAIEIPVVQSSDEDHDGTAEAEITGGVHTDTGLVGLRFGISRGTLEPEFSQDIRNYEFIVPANESSVPAVTAAMDAGITADITQASDFGDNSTAVIRVHGRKDNIYKVKFVKDSSNRSEAPVIYAESTPVMRDTPIYILGSGTVYYTFDGMEPTVYDNVYNTVYISADILNLPSDYRTLTIKAFSVEEGKEPSKVVTAEFVLPDPALKLSGVTVNGSAIPGADSGKTDLTYTISYKDWKAGNNVYTLSAVPLISSSKISAEPAQISFDCTDGKGAEKTAAVTVVSAEGASKTYNVTLKVLDCEHSSSDWKYEDTAGCDHSGLMITSCSVCGKIIGEDFSEAIGMHQAGTPVTTAATCGADGSIVTSCLICGKEISRETIPASGAHVWSVTSQDSTSVRRECSVCHISEDIAINPGMIEHTHVFSGTENIITEPTCSSEGIKRVFCSEEGCGAYIDEKMPVKAHSPSSVPETTAATCTENGSITTKCSVCGEVIKTETIPAFGHYFNFESGIPTCAGDTELTAECENGCGTVQTYIIPRSSVHRNVLESSESGHWYECSVCGAKSMIEEHSYDDQYIYDKNGIPQTLVRSCTVCDYYTMSEIKTSADPDAYAHQHIYGSTWKTDGSKHWKECTSCGEKTDIAVHTENAGVTSGSETKYSCTVCGQLIRTEKHVHTSSSGYQTDGTYHWRVCSSCGEIYDRAAHTENGGIVTADAAIGSAGEKTYNCSVCRYEMRKEVIPALENPLSEMPVEIASAAEDSPLLFINEETSEVIPESEAGMISTYVESATLNMKTVADLSEENHITITDIYDISLLYTDSHHHTAEVQPVNPITVTIPVPVLPENVTGSQLSVYHREEDGTFKLQPTVFNAKDNTLSFTADHFSIYVIAMPEDALDPEQEPEQKPEPGKPGTEHFTPIPPSGIHPSSSPSDTVPDISKNDDVSSAEADKKDSGSSEDVSSASGIAGDIMKHTSSGVYYAAILLAGTAAAMLVFRRRNKKQK